MKQVHLPKIFIALLAFLILTFLLGKSLSVNFNQHQLYQNAIVKLQEQDATFNQDILKSRNELFNSYDSIAHNLVLEKKLQKQLHEIPVFIDVIGNKQIHNLLATQAELLQQKESLSKRFKFQNATLKNSLICLPLLITEIKETSATQAWFLLLETTLNNLMYHILLYNLTGNEELKPNIKLQIEKLLQIKDKYGISKNEISIKLAIYHANIILNNKPLVDDLTRKIINISLVN